jgi:hypothetical protein
MDHELLRLRCLEVAQGEGLKGPEMIKRAQELFEFLRYGQDDATEARRMVSGEPPMARAVGRDGDFEKPFRDYLAPRDS